MNAFDLISAAEASGLIPSASKSLSIPVPPSPINLGESPVFAIGKDLRRGSKSVDLDLTSEILEPSVETDDETNMFNGFGIEFYAWYTPFHQNLNHWGVYIRARGVELLGSKLSQRGVPWNTAFDEAYKLLLAHELCHLEVEFKITEYELMEERHLYLPGKRLLVESAPWFNEEEALCNLAMIKASKGVTRDAIRRITTNPHIPGYSDWPSLERLPVTSAWGNVLGPIVRRRTGLAIPPIKAFGEQALREKPPLIVMDGSGRNGIVSAPFSFNP